MKHSYAARIATYLVVLLSWMTFIPASADELQWPQKTTYHNVNINGKKIFYREAGERKNPTIVLLHGFPSSSHSYRELIPLLSGSYHIIAPDYLGSGYSEHPDPGLMPYTFDLLAEYLAKFLDVIDVGKYTIYMQDFGAPVGYRLIMKQPDRLNGLIIQNANAYLEGLTPARRAFFKKAHTNRSPEDIANLYSYVSEQGVIAGQYLRNINGRESLISPDSWTHDLAFLATEKDRKIQVQLFQDYWNNILAYPEWQGFLRKKLPPTLIVWGKNDQAFIAAGATAYLKDLPDAELHLIDAGHFALEEKPVEIARLIHRYMKKTQPLGSS